MMSLSRLRVVFMLFVMAFIILWMVTVYNGILRNVSAKRPHTVVPFDASDAHSLAQSCQRACSEAEVATIDC